jgi:hypothetical protein
VRGCAQDPDPPAGVLDDPAGAEDSVTSCDLRIFIDQPAEPVPAQNTHTGHVGGRLRATGGRMLLRCPVRSVSVVITSI